MADDPAVSYTVKELVARLEGKLDGFLLALQGKADRSEVEGLHERVSTLEASEHARSGWRANWKFLGGVFAFLVSNGALWAAVLHR